MQLLEALLPEIRRLHERGRLSADVRRLVTEWSTIAKPERSDPRSDPRSDRFREPMIDGVSTRTAADRLGITTRAVVARCHRGTLHAEQQPDGTWLVDPEALP